MSWSVISKFKTLLTLTPSHPPFYIYKGRCRLSLNGPMANTTQPYIRHDSRPIGHLIRSTNMHMQSLDSPCGPPATTNFVNLLYNTNLSPEITNDASPKIPTCWFDVVQRMMFKLSTIVFNCKGTKHKNILTISLIVSNYFTLNNEHNYGDLCVLI